MTRFSIVAFVGLVILPLLALAVNYHGININDPAFSPLFAAENDVKYDDVTSFEDLYNNYIGVKGTLVIDCREYPEALTIIYNTYIVPASIFPLHKDIFPANRNYFIYGPVEQCAKIQYILKNERGATFAKLIDLRPGQDITKVWKGDFQYKLPPYYETISVDDMYGRWIDGEPEEGDPILVDVRSPAEFRREHIKYAVNVPISELRKNFDVLPVTQKVYLYAANDTMALNAAEMFAAEYRTYSMPILGGITEWAAKGYPVESSVKTRSLF